MFCRDNIELKRYLAIKIALGQSSTVNRMKQAIQGIAAALFVLASSHAFAESLPQAIVSQLPKGYEAILVQAGDFNQDKAKDYLVVAGMKTENQPGDSGEPAPRRWLLAFIQTSSGKYTLVGKNEKVAFAADQGGQCDPLLDSGGLVTKGPYFTVENSVACGDHWTDDITFKYDKRHGGFLFYKRIFEAWRLNTSTKSDAEALVRSNRTVTSANRDKPIALDNYSPQ